ncbi:MAG: phosphoribosylformylglycinamidine synthase subunit PurS [Candidatus Poribacteria bacterium]|nr:phosphoribosylformylglycinamidine synthase subunit PurS [Candidatus Poribacteria bacterium]
MNNWKVEIFYKPEVPDTIGQGILEDIADLGISGVDSVKTATVYWIEGSLNSHTIERIGTELLADPITQLFTSNADNEKIKDWTVEVQFKPGVTDAVGDSTVKGIRDLGIEGVETVRTGQKFWLSGTLSAEIIESIAQRLLMNDVIQTFSYQEPQA